MSTTGRHAAAVAILIAAVFAAYGPSLRNGFVFDDAMFVRDDPRLRTLGESRRLFAEPLWGYLDEEGMRHLHEYYRPLQTFPLALVRVVVPEDAWPAHLLSLILHAANAVLVWSILRSLLGSAGVALSLALLWAVHPGYSEAVLWISNLAGLGVALSILAIFRLHLAAGKLSTDGQGDCTSGKMDDAWTARSVAICAIGGLLMLGGLLFHEIGIVAPLLLVAYEATAARPARWRRLAMECAALVAALAVYAWLRARALGALLPGFGELALGPRELMINAIGLLPQYARTFLWPFDLNMYHDFDPIGGIGDVRLLAGAALVVGYAALFAATRRRRPLIAFSILWIAVVIAPYLIVRWPHLNVFAERYLYLPAVGVFLLLGAAWGWLNERRPPAPALRRAAVAAVAAACCVGLVMIWRRTPDWHDDVTLYSKTLTQSRRAWLIRNNLAVHHLRENRYEDGIRVLHEALSVAGTMPEGAHNLGLLRAELGDDAGALRAFLAASRAGTPKLSTLLNLGYMYDRVGKRREAVITYMKLLARNRDYVAAWFNLAMIAFEAGQYDNARTAVARVLLLSPYDAEALELQHRLRELAADKAPAVLVPAAPTRRACRQAMKLARRRRFDEAIAILNAAAWLDEAAAKPHQYLANIAALRGDLATALAEQRQALKRAPDNPLYQRNVAALERTLAEERPPGGGQ
jgi:tetratricopeptide (TPR) repeat protein